MASQDTAQNASSSSSSPSETRDCKISLNQNVWGLKPSATVAINERSDQLRAEGQHVFKLGLGQSPFPVPNVVVEALRVNAWRKDYLPVAGVAELRQAVADYHRRFDGLAATADDVLIGPGSKELMFLLQVVFDGEFIIPTPAWVSYAPQARILGRQVAFIHTRAKAGWKLTPRQVHEHCRHEPERPRVIVLNYPSNPTGGTYHSDELAELAAVAQRFGIILLSDEIYGELDHAGMHQSIGRHYDQGTIISSGLSKWCGAGGWRLGTFTFPQKLRPLLEAMASVASETYTSTSAPVQYAAVRAFEGGPEIEQYLLQSRRILKHLGEACCGRLEAAGVSVLHPQGAFYLFPDFDPLRERLTAREIRTSSQLCGRLLDETGVAILPGSHFGRDPNELTARLAYVDFDGARALAAAEQVPLDKPLNDDYLAAHCGNVLEAIDRLCEWVVL